MGKLTITHPFHPLRGQSYDILKVKEVSGAKRYSLRIGNDVLCVPESWTDRHIYQLDSTETEQVPFNVFCLFELVTLLKEKKNFVEISPNTVDNKN